MVHAAAGLAGVLLFEGPRSFTGERVAELHVPDRRWEWFMVRAVMDEMLAAGRGRGADGGGGGIFGAGVF